MRSTSEWRVGRLGRFTSERDRDYFLSSESGETRLGCNASSQWIEFQTMKMKQYHCRRVTVHIGARVAAQSTAAQQCRPASSPMSICAMHPGSTPYTRCFENGTFQIEATASLSAKLVT